MTRTQRLLIVAAACAVTAGVLATDAAAQDQVPTYGFEVSAPAFPTGVERQRQPDLWMMDVELKSMRLRRLSVTDPATGRRSDEDVWYLVYRAYNRPIRGSGTTDDTQPVAELDEPLTRPLFVPRFTLVTYDDRASEIPAQTIVDEVSPEIIAQLRPIEDRRDVKIAGPVEAIRELPEPSDTVEPVYGVAVFRGVDPDTDFFKVVMRGFTNAYEIRDEEDGRRVWRKALVQRFVRRGDRFDVNQGEFEFDGEPEWTYLPGELASELDVTTVGE